MGVVWQNQKLLHDTQKANPKTNIGKKKQKRKSSFTSVSNLNRGNSGFLKSKDRVIELCWEHSKVAMLLPNCIQTSLKVHALII